MGIDYDGVGGVGIELTPRFVDDVIKKGFFTEEDWAEDEYDCIDETFNCPFDQAGNVFSGGGYWYLFVEGNTLGEINNNARGFVEMLKTKGIEITVDDLQIISDYSVS